MSKKSFFKTNTPSQIRDLGSGKTVNDNLVSRIIDLSPGDHLVIDQPFLSVGHRKYKKHAQDLKLRRYDSQEELRKNRVIPVRERAEAFNSLKARYEKTGEESLLSGYSVRPAKGFVDERTRRFSLVGNIEGARLFAYAHQIPGVEINLEDYDDARAVAREGAYYVFGVPSREKKEKRHVVGLMNVPIIDNGEKFVITPTITSDHTCQDKRYNRELRYNQPEGERSRIEQFCPHDVAAYLELANKFWQEDKNIIPLQMSQFALPTQFTVDYYKKLLNNVLIQNKKKTSMKKLNQAEQEALLWGLVTRFGHDKTFFATEDLKKYDWRVE